MAYERVSRSLSEANKIDHERVEREYSAFIPLFTSFYVFFHLFSLFMELLGFWCCQSTIRV